MSDEDLVRRLEHLTELHAAGALTDAEFASAKDRLLRTGAGASAPAAERSRPATGTASGFAGRGPLIVLGAIVAVVVLVVVVAMNVGGSPSSEAGSIIGPEEGAGGTAASSPGAGRSCPNSTVCINGGDGLVLGVVHAEYDQSHVRSLPSLGANTRLSGDRWLMKTTLEIGNVSGSSLSINFSGLQVVTTSGSLADYFQSNSGRSISGCPKLSTPDVVSPGQWVTPPERLCFLIPKGETPAALRFGTYGSEVPLPSSSF